MGDGDPKSLRAGHYFLAVEGLAMIRDFLTDPEGMAPRAQDMARIVESMEEFPQSLAIPVTRYDVEPGYTRWAPRYDGPNPAIAAEEPVFAELLAGVSAPGRVALDAACGTGRHASMLAAAGWEVIGVDATAAMLEIARGKVPSGEFRLGDLRSLPLEDASVDLVTCGLALTHVEDLDPVFAEFARVLRPGGQVVTTDMHPMVIATGGMAAFPVDEDDRSAPLAIHYVPNIVHPVSAYVTAMVRAGLSVLDCREQGVAEDMIAGFPSYVMFPDATREAFLGLPYLLMWRSERPA
jgi:ubiquinone/menaquinone biosynthesis C-methylase UbiE